MHKTSITATSQKIYNLLFRKRAKEALDQLALMVKETHNSDLIDAHYNSEMTYKSLLRYTVEGFTDPERQQVYNRLLADIYRLTDRVTDFLQTRDGTGWLFETRRRLNALAESGLAGVFEDYLKESDHFAVASTVDADTGIPPVLDNLVRQLFEVMATQPRLTQHREPIRNILFGDDYLWPWQSLMTSALTINLLTSFQEANLQLLFDLCRHPHLQIKQRAFTGLLLVLFKYDQRLPLLPSVTTRIKELNDLFSSQMIQTILIQIIRTRETEKLTKRMNEEIIPEVARMQPNLRKKLDLDNILGEKFMEDKNPDWSNLFSDSPELMDKLEELSKLQMEGADLFLSTFKMLKHFPFFNEIHHWFLPFFYPNPIVNNALKEEKGPLADKDLLTSMADSGILCNSDKYSLIMSIPHMPSMQKEMMGKMFGAEIEAMKEVETSDRLVDPEKKALAISNQYIQDLYRFFRLHPRKSSFDDPFSWPMDFHNKWFLSLLAPGDNLALKLGEYLFEKDYYAEALEVYNKEITSGQPDKQKLQKLAFCHQQLGHYEQALKFYLQADLFGEAQVWNLKKIALCYRYLKNPEKALEYYKAAENMDADNLHTQVSIGDCLLELKEYEEALKYYFKVEYLDPKNHKVWRPIAWCSFVLGKFDQAGKYSEKAIQISPNRHDYMNLGHTLWCRGSRKEALDHYLKSMKETGTTLSEFINSFTEDQPILIQHGVDETDIPIMLDQLRYYLEEGS